MATLKAELADDAATENVTVDAYCDKKAFYRKTYNQIWFE